MCLNKIISEEKCTEEIGYKIYIKKDGSYFSPFMNRSDQLHYSLGERYTAIKEYIASYKSIWSEDSKPIYLSGFHYFPDLDTAKNVFSRATSEKEIVLIKCKCFNRFITGSQIMLYVSYPVNVCDEIELIEEIKEDEIQS